MTPHGALVARPEEEPAKELALNAQVIVLRGRVFHILVHGAKGHCLAARIRRGTRGIGNRTAGAAGVIARPDGIGVRVIDGVGPRGVEVDQSIERRIPRAVRPDVIEDAVVQNAVTTANGHPALPRWIPCKSNARRVVVVPGGPHPGNRIHSQGIEAGRVQNVATEVRELGNNSINFSWRAVTLPTNAQIESQVLSDLPVVLHKPIVVVVVIMPISICMCARSGIDGGFLKIRVVAGEVSLSAIQKAGDSAVWLPGISVTGIRFRSDHKASAWIDRSELAEFVLSRQAQIPVAIEDAVRPAAAKFEGMPAYRPTKVVRDAPTVLDEADDLAALIVSA